MLISRGTWTELSGYAVTSLAFALLFLSCSYNFFRAITLDPGTVRGPPVNSEEMKEVSSARGSFS